MSDTRNTAQPDTRHLHGEVMHDHANGNIPHDHHENATGKRGLFWSLWPVFLFLAIICGVMVVYSQQNADECSDALVAAFNASQCQQVTVFHEVGVAGVIIFGLLMVAGLLSGRAR
jgi:hypothetical protein